MTPRPHPVHQRGGALLLAMLTVALVATLASSALWQQWRGIEVEQAERDRLQAGWILTGALDWARLILREDARANQNTGSGDHLAEPWAVGLQEARLSSFLAVEPGGEAPAAFDAFLSGVIQDQQARLNATNLVHQGQVSDTDLRAFARLYEQLGLPLPELQALASSLLRAQQAAQGQTSATAAGVPIALLPTRITQLTWLGLSGRSLQRLAPYITVLPERTPVNLNTAAPEVLVAVVPGLDMARARRLAEARALQPFKTLADASSLLGGDLTLKEAQHATTSRYFEVMGRLRLGERVVQERSLVQRNGLDVKALWRERTASRIELPPGAPAVGQTPSLQ